MRKTQSVEIDGEAYSVTYFSATKSLEVLIELSKLAGEPVASLFSDSGDVLDVDLKEILPKAVRALVGGMDKANTVALIKQIIDSASKDGQPILPGFDVMFAGRIGHLLKLIGSILKMQYGDLKNVLGAVAQLQVATPKR